MDAEQLVHTLHALAPDSGGLVAVAIALVYVSRIVRAELREQRASRAQTSTVGGRTGAVERDLAALAVALHAQGIYVPTQPDPRPAAPPRPPLPYDDEEEDGPVTEVRRVPVPAFSTDEGARLSRHRRDRV